MCDINMKINLNVFDDDYLEQNPKVLYIIASVQGLIVGLIAGVLIGVGL